MILFAKGSRKIYLVGGKIKSVCIRLEKIKCLSTFDEFRLRGAKLPKALAASGKQELRLRCGELLPVDGVGVS